MLLKNLPRLSKRTLLASLGVSGLLQVLMLFSGFELLWFEAKWTLDPMTLGSMPKPDTPPPPIACQVPLDPLGERGNELLVRFGEELIQICEDKTPMKGEWESRSKLTVSPCSSPPTMVQFKLKTDLYTPKGLRLEGLVPTRHSTIPDAWTFEGMDELATVFLIQCPGGSSNIEVRSPPLAKTVPEYEERVKSAKLWTDQLGHTPYNFISLTTDSVSVGLVERVSPALIRVLNGQDPRYPQAAETGFRLGGINSLGDGTINAFLPFLTGNIEQELPDARRSSLPEDFDKSPLEDFPWIFRPAQEKGYITSWQSTELDIWNYRLSGFETPPWDTDIRLAWVAYERARRRKVNACTENPSALCMKYVKDLAKQSDSINMPLFAMCHMLDSHLTNPLAMKHVEGPYLDFLKWYWSPEAAHIAENTILYIGSDHGPRYGDLRKEKEGKVMERRPFGYFFLPPKLLRERPYIAEHLRANEHALTTYRDVRRTVASLLRMSDSVEPAICAQHSDLCELSLVDQNTPANRTCDSAVIEPAWCSCVSNTVLDIPPHIEPLLISALGCLGNHLDSNSDLGKCTKQSIASIDKITALTLPKTMIAFQQSKDEDGYIPDFDMSSVDLSTLLIGEYMLSITTRPSSPAAVVETAHYDISLDLPWMEAALMLDKDSNLVFKESPAFQAPDSCVPSVITRTDEYASTLVCTPASTTVENFCLCKA